MTEEKDGSEGRKVKTEVEEGKKVRKGGKGRKGMIDR
jgi:hypothetical protein